ncbi:MAG TPA: serine/threonine-protein kinase [Drouetiella sp.]|jgi:tRNA A-37 threonylcarbamoyl transferase component Bud32
MRDEGAGRLDPIFPGKIARRAHIVGNSMPQREHIICYRTVPTWFVPAVAGCCAGLSIAIVFGATSLALMLIPELSGGPQYVFLETCLRATVVIFLLFIAYLTNEVARHDQVLLSEEGLYFPLFLGPDLLFRRRRNWDDIGNILLGAMLLEDRKGTYEYELEQAKDKKKLFIYFKSGGHVTLDLARMPKESVERIFQSIESWCIACTRSPQLSPKDNKQALKTASAVKQDKLSYTKMWEDELHSHFSATNFVPLEKGRTMQEGRYSILMQLSSGGLSAVYLAELGDKDLVIIKEAALPADLKEESCLKAKAMFAREAELLRIIEHPFIAKVLDNFVEKGRDYLVLEFVPGESLRQIVRKCGALSEQSVLQHALKIAHILDYLHNLKPSVIHRDLTPDNLVVRQDGEVILIDFGAANTLVGTATGTIVGKQAYIAPEQFRGKASEKSDLYALGATLYFLITGEDPEALSESHPRSKRSEISEDLDNLVGRCTAIDTKKRVGSADELIDIIETLLPSTVLKVGSSNEGH